MPRQFRTPRIGIAKVYTRTGDAGDTGLVGGQRVAKDDPRIAAYGDVDELNACVGLARQACLADKRLASLAVRLLRVQHQLFNLGSCLATLPQDLGPQQPRTTEADIRWLERDMDRATARLPALRSFVLPGGLPANAALHLARTVCRRAERKVVALWRRTDAYGTEMRYLNRLSDALFVWSREASRLAGAGEVLWQPEQAGGARGVCAGRGSGPSL